MPLSAPLLPDSEHARINALARNPYTRARAAQSMVAHALARAALSALCRRVAPQNWHFVRNAHGKPRIANTPQDGRGWPAFCLSHSSQRAVCAVSLQGQVGVDVESWCRATSAMAVAVGARFFAAHEQAWLASLSPKQRRQNFIRLWTLKEAALKLYGRPLSQLTRDLAFAPMPKGGMRGAGRWPSAPLGPARHVAATRQETLGAGAHAVCTRWRVPHDGREAHDTNGMHDCISVIATRPAGGRVRFVWHVGWPCPFPIERGTVHRRLA